MIVPKRPQVRSKSVTVTRKPPKRLVKPHNSDTLEIQNILARANVPEREPTSESVMEHALATFGVPSKVTSWMSRPHPLFDRRAPADVLIHDPKAVEAELTRIDHGVYV